MLREILEKNFKFYEEPQTGYRDIVCDYDQAIREIGEEIDKLKKKITKWISPRTYRLCKDGLDYNQALADVRKKLGIKED